MAKIKFSNDDIKSGFLVKTPGHYTYEIQKVTSKPASTDGSPNYLFRFKGLNGEMEGVTVFVQISSKASWLMAPIFKAANNGVLDPEVEYDPEDLVGIQISAMTTRGTRQDGSLQNVLSDYRPVE